MGTPRYTEPALAALQAVCPQVVLKASTDTCGWLVCPSAREAILLSPQGYVSECTGENLFVVRNGAIVTPPSSAGALEGITQSSVRRIAEDHGIPYEQGNILRSDLYTADEAFLSGTAAEVVPIRSVDDRVIGAPGPITSRIQDVYFQAVRGERPEYAGWNEHVSA